MERYILRLEKGDATVCVTRKKMKNLRLRVVGDEVRVSAPVFVTRRAITDFVEGNRAFIEARWKPAEATPPITQGRTVLILGARVAVRVVQAKKTNAELCEGTLTLFSNKTDEAALEKQLERFLHDFALEYLKKRAQVFMPLVGDFSPSYCARVMRTRLGSCRADACKISFNTRIIGATPECVDLIVAHELSHLLVQNHGAGFYAVLSRLIPDYKRRRKALRAQLSELLA